VATLRAGNPGVWKVRAFVGNDERGPKQVGRTVRGTKREMDGADAGVAATLASALEET
jgi:hypothetical protein